VVGDAGVGKSSLILRYAENIFTTAHINTIGVDFKIMTSDVNGKRVKVSNIAARCPRFI
jgi:GTPase SAR1 family protein